MPIAAVFGLLVAVEDSCLAWLLWAPGADWNWYLAVPLLLALLAIAASAAVFWRRPLGWLLLAVAAALSLLGLLALAVLFALLGGGQAFWTALLLLIGPLGALVLASRRSVRQWTGSGRARRPPGGRRTDGEAR
ncbi:MAG: rane protein of unknown function [Blastococcus sp.]|nr:rane protein of unknown function [Blastococcus sp.]